MKFKKLSWWCDTILCYNAGMFFSYYKENIFSFLKNNKHYVLTIILLLIIFLLAYKNDYNYFIYEVTSLSFVLIAILLTLKIYIGNKMLLWLGKNTFNIYILQRLSYIFYDYVGVKDYNIYLYFFISLITIIISTFIFDRITRKITKTLC